MREIIFATISSSPIYHTHLSHAAVYFTVHNNNFNKCIKIAIIEEIVVEIVFVNFSPLRRSVKIHVPGKILCHVHILCIYVFLYKLSKKKV